MAFAVLSFRLKAQTPLLAALLEVDGYARTSSRENRSAH